MTSTPQKYCHDICKKSKSNFLFTVPFLKKKEQRDALEAFYAFCNTIDAIVDTAEDNKSAQTALNEWKIELDRISTGDPESYIGKALTTPLVQYHIPKEYLLEIVRGCEMDLVKNEYSTFEELELYCYRVASCVGLVCIRLFEITPTKEHEKTAIALGKALQLTNILRDVREDLHRHRIYLPHEDRERFQVTLPDLEQGKSKNLSSLFAFEIDRAKNFFQLAFAGIENSSERKKWFPALLMGRTYAKILEHIEQNPLLVYEKKITLPKWEKIIMMIKTWIENSKKS